MATGLAYELKEFNIDCTSWRIATVTENAGDDKEQDVTAADYVKQAFNKCTSGVHYGHW